MRRSSQSASAGRIGAVGPKAAALLAPAALGLAFAAFPTAVAHQDLASYVARQSGADQTWRRRLANEIHPSMRLASFAFARPLPADAARDSGVRPLAVRLGEGMVGGDPRRADRLSGPPIGPTHAWSIDYPRVDRSAKGDMLAPRRPIRAEGAPPLVVTQSVEATPVQVAPAGLRAHDGVVAGAAAGALGEAGEPSGTAPTLSLADVDDRARPEMLADDAAGVAVVRSGPIGMVSVGLGVRPLPVENAALRVHGTHEPVPGFDPILDALATDRRGDRPDPVLAGLFQPPPQLRLEEEAAAPRSEIRRPSPSHPALTLALSGPARARAERCLAEAVYWEARGEPENGQVAVAQVVVNRAVSGFYPRDVCGVVYQNAHRYLACQFTFACEGRRSLVPTEPQPWSVAQRVAKDMLDGRAWIPQVGHATHYHANYVRPRWARTMNMLKTIGVHLFYRPRQWGSGEI